MFYKVEEGSINLDSIDYVLISNKNNINFVQKNGIVFCLSLTPETRAKLRAALNEEEAI